MLRPFLIIYIATVKKLARRVQTTGTLSGTRHIGNNFDTNEILFSFNGPINAFGLFTTDLDGEDVTISFENGSLVAMISTMSPAYFQYQGNERRKCYGKILSWLTYSTWTTLRRFSLTLSTAFLGEIDLLGHSRLTVMCDA